MDLASPLTLGQPEAPTDEDDDAAEPTDAPGPARTWPLVELTGRRLWAASALGADFQQMEPDPATTAERFLVAAAAERGDARLVTVATPVLASDAVMRLVQPVYEDATGAVSLARVYPANGELFVNSVYWLLGMDRLVAASAQTQDVGRIGDVSPTAQSVLLWVLPTAGFVLPLVAGTVVWLVRRSA